MSSQESLDRVRNLDMVVLRDVVRQDQRDPHFEITEWAAGRLAERGAASREGLYCLYGTGRSGHVVRPWSVVLKISTTPEHAIPDPSNLWQLRREWLVYQSGLLNALPAPPAVPRCYGIHEQTDGVWMWLERITEKNPGRWGLQEFSFAARELGRFGGAYAAGRPNPDQPWLSRHQPQAWTQFWTPEATWDAENVRRVFSSLARARIMRLWDERERFMAVLDGLPQVFSHGDCSRRNLMIRSRLDGDDELVALDWALCGIRPLGADLSTLVCMSCGVFEWEPSDVARLERVAEPAYLDGLRDAGWRGDPRVVRLAYTAWTALWHGVTMPHGIAALATQEQRAWLRHQFNRSPDEFATDWAALCEYALERADEAQRLIVSLGIRDA